MKNASDELLSELKIQSNEPTAFEKCKNKQLLKNIGCCINRNSCEYCDYRTYYDCVEKLITDIMGGCHEQGTC